MINYEHVIEKLFGAIPLAAARAHARVEFPNESCGFIASGRYYPCENKAENPREDFEIDDPTYVKFYTRGEVQAIVHSHPATEDSPLPFCPSQKDMEQQLATELPWIILTLNEDVHGKMVAWGDSLPIMPVLARPFVHGVFDCYSLVRDTFRLGREALAKEMIAWPFDPVELPQFARGDGWWEEGDDLYLKNFEKAGFRVIDQSEVRPGDCFLMRFGMRRFNPHNQLNHAGVILEHDMVLHHLPTKLSARAPAGQWVYAADLFVRHEVSR